MSFATGAHKCVHALLLPQERTNACIHDFGHRVAQMSAEVVDTNPYSRLMALQRMGVVKVGIQNTQISKSLFVLQRMGVGKVGIYNTKYRLPVAGPTEKGGCSRRVAEIFLKVRLSYRRWTWSRWACKMHDAHGWSCRGIVALRQACHGGISDNLFVLKRMSVVQVDMQRKMDAVKNLFLR